MREDGGDEITIFVNGGWASSSGLNRSWVGAWTHFVVRCDGDNTKVYMNGNLTPVIIRTSKVNPESGLILGGYNPTGPSEFMGARMDEVYIWNNNISDAALTALYNLGEGKFYTVAGGDAHLDVQDNLNVGGDAAIGGDATIAAAKSFDAYANSGYVKLRRVSHADQQVAIEGELLVWRDPDDGKTYLIINDADEGARKVELT